MLLLGIDLETDGLDPKVNNILEVGAVLYDWDTKTPVQMLSEFIDPDYAGNSNAGYKATTCSRSSVYVYVVLLIPIPSPSLYEPSLKIHLRYYSSYHRPHF